jgi:hypothetical protein
VKLGLEHYRTALSLAKEGGLELEAPMPVSSGLIDDLERRLNVRLPLSYRQAVAEYGLLAIGNIEIAGIGITGFEGKTALNVVFGTEKDRADELITQSMITISFAGDGRFYAIDCAQLSEDGEAPVYEIPVGGIKYGKDKVADSFGDFLLDQVRNQLEPYALEDEAVEKARERARRQKEQADYWKQRAKDFE